MRCSKTPRPPIKGNLTSASNVEVVKVHACLASTYRAVLMQQANSLAHKLVNDVPNVATFLATLFHIRPSRVSFQLHSNDRKAANCASKACSDLCTAVMKRREHFTQLFNLHLANFIYFGFPQLNITDVTIVLRLVDVVESFQNAPSPHLNGIEIGLHIRQYDSLVARRLSLPPIVLSICQILSGSVRGFGLLVGLPTEIRNGGGGNAGNQKRSNCHDHHPSVPPNNAIVDTQWKACTNPIPPAHSLIPLWTRRHSAMPRRRAENCHG